MSYQYTEFDGVPIALFDHTQGHDSMPSESTLLDSIGGAYNWRGTERRKGRKQTIAPTGKYFGETEYFVDETGDLLVDETGDYLIAGDGPTMLAAQARALFEKKGVSGPLWRRRLADGVLQWKTFSLLNIQWPRKWDDHAVKAEITAYFETLMEFWRADTATTTSGSATDGTPLGLTVDNAGETVDDAVITITRTSGTITTVSLISVELGISLGWTGSLGASEILTIDCGAQTVRKSSTDSYSGFSLGGSHTAAGWLPLTSGANPIVVTVTGGNATVAISHYNQYP